MEKISALIDKLQELKNSNAGLQSISYYVQLLQAEILHARNRQKKEEQPDNEQSHIAVIMPTASLNEPAIINGYTTTYNQTPAQTVAQRPIAVQTPAPEPEYQPVTAQTPVIPEKEELVTAAPEKHVEPVKAEVKAEPIQEPPTVQPLAAEIPQRPTAVPAPPPAPLPAEPVEKKPAMITLFSQTETKPEANGGLQTELKELNQRVAQNTTSLNERFRQGHVELADKLGEMPVKDLRQAIGINDKFQFIQELFRGDIDTYERSIKTINDFHSMQEAEYWIERELKIRQGWEDDNRLVKQFYSLVRKRFT